MIKNYFRTAWRSLWKNKTFSSINIFGLSVGVAVAMIVLIALLTVLYQSLKAALRNPVKNLRSE